MHDSNSSRNQDPRDAGRDHRPPQPATKAVFNVPIGTLVLRLALGVVFLAHGVFKYAVLGLGRTAEYFANHGFPGWLAYPVFVVEIVAGLMLVVGFGSRWAALSLIPVAFGALLVHAANGWYFGAQGGGWEYLAFLIAALVAQASLGDGALAVGSLRFARLRPEHRENSGR